MIIFQSACQRWSLEDPDDFIRGGLTATPKDFPWMVCSKPFRGLYQYLRLYQNICSMLPGCFRIFGFHSK